MKIYYLWYIPEPQSDKIIVGCAREYEAAEQISIQLEFELTVLLKKPLYKIGITRTVVNKIVFDLSDIDSTWVIYKKGNWFLENMELKDGIERESNFIH